MYIIGYATSFNREVLKDEPLINFIIVSHEVSLHVNVLTSYSTLCPNDVNKNVIII